MCVQLNPAIMLGFSELNATPFEGEILMKVQHTATSVRAVLSISPRWQLGTNSLHLHPLLVPLSHTTASLLRQARHRPGDLEDDESPIRGKENVAHPREEREALVRRVRVLGH